MVISEYPIEIINRVLEINPACDINNETINDAFNWSNTKEGSTFWGEIYRNRIDGFYELYPKEGDGLCYATIQKGYFYLHSFISPATAKMVVDKNQAKLLIEKLNEFVK